MKNLVKKYSKLAFLANLFTAISISGLSVLGVLSSDIALPLLIILAVIFGLLGLIGRFVHEDLKDDGKPFYEDGDDAK